MFLLSSRRLTLFKEKNALVSLLIFCILMAIVAFMSFQTYRSSVDSSKRTALRTAEIQSNVLTHQMNSGRNIAEALKWMVIDNGGSIHNFDAVSESMITDNIQSIQIAPNGVVSNIYPSAGNEAGKIDLLADKSRGNVALYSIKKNIITVQGSFALKQGGYGMALRDPIFINDANGNSQFWGFSIVMIKTPGFFENTVGTLTNLGYNYRLSKEISPLIQDMTTVAMSKDFPESPVSHDFSWGGCFWKLEISPTAGWANIADTRNVAIFGTLTSILLSLMVFLILTINDTRKTLRAITVRDPLTGTLNRYAFDEEVKNYMEEHVGESAVLAMVDVDRFNLINDRYGHEVGDEILTRLTMDMRSTFGQEAIIGRNGGDEFVVFLPHMDGREAEELFNRFTRLKKSCIYKENAYGFTTSAGYAEYPIQARNLGTLLHLAGIARSIVKIRGKNGALCYNNAMRAGGEETGELLMRNIPG